MELLILDHCEGLYLRKDVKSGQIVSLFNGLRCQSSRNQMIGQPNYDYRIKLNGEIDIDIPLNCTGKSLTETFILTSTNPQHDNRLFSESPVQYMRILRTYCVHKLFVLII